MILIVFGLPGTGKSYLARHIAEENKTLYLNTDIVREKLNKKGQYDDETKREVYGRLLKEISSPDAKETMVIIDGTFSSKTFRFMFNKYSWEQERSLYYIEMKARESEIKKRMKEDRAYSEADYSVYKKMKKAFDYMPEEHLVMQSDELEIDEMKAKVKALYNGEEADTGIY
jgi:predicted kinase